MNSKIKWLKVVAHIAVIVCIFFVGFIVASNTLQGDLEVPTNESDPTTDLGIQDDTSDEMWHRFGVMTFSDMRNAIMEFGADVFEDTTGINIIFDNPSDIVSIADPHVLARGYSDSEQTFIHVLFTYQHWRNGWRVDGYGLWDYWYAQPHMVRGAREGLRSVDADTVDVRFYGIVDWGGGEIAEPVLVSLPGQDFAERFIPLFRQHLGVNMLDMWFIGENRLYVNLDGELMDTQGSAAGFAILVSLYRTLFSLSDIEEIVVLVEGQSEQMSDHMGFPHINRRSDPEIQSWLGFDN
jgi:hypothetical protein